jgi:hypothetical protein
MGSVSANYPVASAYDRVADVLREKFSGVANESLRAALREAYRAGGRSAVSTVLSGRVKPIKRRQVIAAISHAEELALTHRPSLRAVVRRAARGRTDPAPQGQPLRRTVKPAKQYKSLRSAVRA